MNTEKQNHMLSKPQAWSKLGLGTGTLASLGRAMSLSEVERLLDTMSDCGANLIDTADSYGSGDCEILLGKALGGRRSSFHLVTKAGYRLSNLKGPLRPMNQFIKKAIHRLGNSHDFRPAYLAKCLDDSLQRLRVERVGAFLLHDAPLEAVTNPEIHELCHELKQSGKTALTGLSSDQPEIIRAALSTGAFDVIQTPANLVAATELHAVWDECEAHGIHIIGNHVFSPATVALPGMSRENIMRACSSLLPASTTILCGTHNPSHFAETYRWAEHPLGKDEALALAAKCVRLTQSPSS
jgi:pyridoxine 4-dehydrogenase